MKLVDGGSEEMAGGSGEVKLVDRQPEERAGVSGVVKLVHGWSEVIENLSM